MTNIPLPRLIYSPKPAENATLPKEYHPIRVSITENITPLSTATIELPKGENLTARGYVELFTPKGSAGVFRVRSPEDAYGDEITRAELEHAITEVGDYLVTHEYSEMMAARTAMQTIFSYYTSGHASGETARWQLNATALPSSNVAVTVNHERVLDAMLAILEQVPNYMMAFNFETSPWTVYFKQRDQKVTAEGRLSRNIESARITYDDSDLCTRVYYERQKANSEETEWVFKDADTMSTYGMIQRSMSVPSNYTTAEANAAVDEYLRQHKEPRISIEVSAEDLHDATGEDLDSFLLGKLMRITIPDYEITQEKTITKISWSDVYNKGYASVNLTLGQERDTAIKFLHDIDSSGGTASGGRSSGRISRTMNSTNQIIDLYKSKTDNNGEILEAAGLALDEHGTIIYHDDYENQIGSRMQVAEGMASMSVGQLDIPQNKIVTSQTLEDLQRITGQADKYYKVLEPDTQWYVWENDSYKRIAVSYDGKHKYYIKAAEIAVAINEDGSTEAHIDAQKVILGQASLSQGDLDTWAASAYNGTGVFAKFLTVRSLTAQEINTVLANIGSAELGDLDVAAISADSIETTGDIDAGGDVNVNSGSLTVSGDINLGGDFVIDAYEGDDVTMGMHTISINDEEQAKFLGTDDVNFSRATSLTPEWSGTAGAQTLTISGSPEQTPALEYSISFVGSPDTKLYIQGNGNTSAKSIDLSSANRKVLNVPLRVWYEEGSGAEATEVNAYTETREADGTPVYGNGWKKAWGDFASKILDSQKDPETNQLVADQIWIKYPNSTVDGNPVYRRYTVDADAEKAYIKLGNMTVAEMTHNQYALGQANGKTTGWNAARLASLIPDAQASGGSIRVKIPSTTYGTPIDRTFELYSETNNQVVLRYNTAQSGQPVYRTVAQITHNQFNLGKASVDTTAYYNSGARAGSGVDYFDAANANASISAASAMTNEDGQGIPYGGELAAGWALGLYYIKADRTKHYKAYWKVPSPPVVNLQEKSIDCSYSMTVTPDAGYTGLSKVNINHKHGGTSMTLTRGAYNSNSRTYKWTGELSASVTGSKQSWTVYWF